MTGQTRVVNGRKALVERIKQLNDADERQVLKTRSRKTRISSDFVGHTLEVFDGRKYVRVNITDAMIGRPLADFAERPRPTARLKYVSIPPKKMRLVAEMVRGMPVERAIDTLNFTPRIAARHLAKTVKAAAANMLSLEGTDHLHPEDLYVKSIMVDEAPTAKRVRFQSMGRVFRIRKRFCHVSVFLEERHAAVTQPTRPREAADDTDDVETPKKSAAKGARKGSARTKRSAGKKSEASADDKPAARGRKKASPKKKSAKAAPDTDATEAETQSGQVAPDDSAGEQDTEKQ